MRAQGIVSVFPTRVEHKGYWAVATKAPAPEDHWMGWLVRVELYTEGQPYPVMVATYEPDMAFNAYEALKQIYDAEIILDWEKND